MLHDDFSRDFSLIIGAANWSVGASQASAPLGAGL